MPALMVTTIYVRLLEGGETLVPVPAQPKGIDSFEILNNEYLDLNEDVSSIWEFFPGDVVKCSFRNGILVADKLVESSMPDRLLYQLIFLIVKELGSIDAKRLDDFEDEVKQLCMNKNILQRKHPIVAAWIKQNCSRW